MCPLPGLYFQDTLGATSPNYRPITNGISTSSGVTAPLATISTVSAGGIPAEGKATTTVAGATAAAAGGGVGASDKVPVRSSSLQKMAAHIHAAQASLLQSQFVQLEAAFKEQLDELQMELALVTGELCDEQFSLKEDLIQYGKIEAEQEMFVGETLREKEDEERRLQLAGERILKWQVSSDMFTPCLMRKALLSYIERGVLGLRLLNLFNKLAMSPLIKSRVYVSLRDSDQRPSPSQSESLAAPVPGLRGLYYMLYIADGG